MKTRGYADQVLAMARRKGVVRPRDLKPFGIPRATLSRLVERGVMARHGRGLYTLPDFDAGEHQALAYVAARIPKGVLCLLSALHFHGIGTQVPREVWIAIGHKARDPRMEYPPLRIVRFSKGSLSEGIEEHRMAHHPEGCRFILKGAQLFWFGGSIRIGQPRTSICSVAANPEWRNWKKYLRVSVVFHRIWRGRVEGT